MEAHSSASASPCAPRVVARTEVAATRWLKLETLDYDDPAGRRRKWDMASRTTRAAGASADAVAILALLRSRDAPAAVETLLVTQYRPPVGAFTVELPAGLIDAGESAEAAALRELREETGYAGVVSRASGAVAMSPGLTDEAVKLVVVDVDLDAAANRAPQQQLEESEAGLRVRRVALRELLPELERMEADGLVPFAGLYTLAVGLSLGLAGGAAREAE